MEDAAEGEGRGRRGAWDADLGLFCFFVAEDGRGSRFFLFCFFCCGGGVCAFFFTPNVTVYVSTLNHVFALASPSPLRVF